MFGLSSNIYRKMVYALAFDLNYVVYLMSFRGCNMNQQLSIPSKQMCI